MLRVLALLVTSVAFVRVNGTPLPPKGVSPQDLGRIVGGEETTIDKFPYQVGIRFLGAFHCGGSIFSSNIVITAAHCIYNFPPALLSVFAGTSSRTEGGIKRDIQRFIWHEDFDKDTSESDIGLIILEGHLDFSKTIQPIALASEGETIPPGTRAYISGWGTLEDDGNLAESLYSASVTIIDNLVCAKAYIGIVSITESMICASGEPYGGTAPCIGDYGGPLVAGGKVYGYVSWKDKCSEFSLPQIYSNVATLRTWIDANIKKYSSY